MRSRPALAAAILLAVPLCCAACATPRPPDFRLRRVVLYQNGIGHFERTGRLAGDALALRLGAHEVDDALKTLTVVEAGQGRGAVGRTGVMAVAPQTPRAGDVATLAVRFGARPRGDVSVAYAVPTPTWRASYRIVLPRERGASDGWLQAWALVHNVSREDWRSVQLTLASSGPLTFAVNLQRPEFVARPDASGRLVQPTATGAVLSEHSHADHDNDAIADTDDVCTAEDEDRDGWQDEDGCLDPDNDQDRIPDASDRCPNDAETYNGEEDADGCPDRGHVQVEESSMVILDKVYFTSGSAEIRGPSRPILEAIAATLRGNPQIDEVEVQGHAAPGEVDAWGLSAARARAVRQALLDLGVGSARLQARPYGDTRPIDPRSTPGAAERNRRTEFFILAIDDRSTVAAPGPATTATSRGLDASSLARSVRSAATAREVPGGTQYAVREPVTISAGASTLVSILNRRVHAEDVLFFRPGSEVPGSDRHPLRAARVVDDTGMDLVPGPVALFGRGAFVGEGLLDGLAAGENAFVPYALDRSTVVSVETEQDEQPGSVVTLVRGVLTVENADVTRTRYLIEAGARPPARIFLRHARRAGTEVGALPPGTESTPGALLLPVPLTPGRRSVVTVEERRPVRRTIELLADRGTDLGPYLRAPSLSPEHAEALGAIVERRLALGRVEEQIAALRERLADAGARSAELRETLSSLARTGAAAAPLRRQVLDRLRASTTSNEELAARLGALSVEASEQRALLGDAVAALTIGGGSP